MNRPAPRPVSAFGYGRAKVRFAEALDPNVVEAQKSAHVALDAFGRILNVSRDVALMLGYSAEDLIGRRLVNRVDGPDRTTFLGAWMRFRFAGAPFELGLSLRAKNDARIPVSVSIAARAGGTFIVRVCVKNEHPTSNSL